MTPPRATADPLKQILETLVEQIYPEKKTIGLAQALKEMAEGPLKWQQPSPDKLRSLADELETACHQWNTECPALVAVAGLKNAGKSSLVRGFLSKQERQRIPIGLTTSEATRRYVFWLPESLRSHAHASGPFGRILNDVFGSHPEELDADPERATEQYRDAEQLRIPLIAFVAKLDTWGVGLLDCPDIETGNGLDGAHLQQAREMLQKAARLCSAFVIVAQYENMEVDDLWRIAQLVDQTGNRNDKFIAINKCPAKSINDIYAEVKQLATRNNFTLTRPDVNLFCAYDFTKRGCEHFPIILDNGAPLPEGLAVGNEDPSEFPGLLPTFFSWESGAPMPPAPISEERLLLRAVGTLSAENLHACYRQELGRRIKDLVSRSDDTIGERIREQGEKVEACHKEIARAVLKAMTSDESASKKSTSNVSKTNKNRPTPLVNENLVDGLSKIIIDEAPHGLRQLLRVQWALVKLTKRLRGKLPEWFTQWLKKNPPVKLEADELARKIRKCKACSWAIGSQEEVVLAEAITKVFKKFCDTFVNNVEAFRPYVIEYYKNMSGWQHTWACVRIIGVLVGLLALAMLIPIDGGMLSIAYGVGVIELFAAAGITIAATAAQRQAIFTNVQKPIVEAQVGYLTGWIAYQCGLPPVQNSPLVITFEGEMYSIQVIRDLRGERSIEPMAAYRLMKCEMKRVKMRLDKIVKQEGRG